MGNDQVDRMSWKAIEAFREKRAERENSRQTTWSQMGNDQVNGMSGKPWKLSEREELREKLSKWTYSLLLPWLWV